MPPAWSTFTQRGIDLAASLAPGRVWIPITNPDILNQLRTTGTVTFNITMANLPICSELKIRNIYLNLVGATAGVPSLNGVLTHAGNAQARRRDGTTLQLSSPPMTSFAVVGLASGQVPSAPTQAPTAPKDSLPVTTDVLPRRTETTTTTVGAAGLPAFYGRSPVTTWTFALADPNPVNLSGLTKIEVGLDFLAVVS